MITVEADNLIEYLVQSGRLTPAEAKESFAEVLSGGVSNAVIRVSRTGGPDFVVKQSRPQLRTKAAWFSQPERIWRERDMLEELANILPPGVVPRVLFEDRDNFLFAMEAIPSEHHVWKSRLLDGEADPHIGRRLGQLLATIHTRTSGNVELRQRLGDRTIFDELRLDPFYRYVAERQPELTAPLTRLIDDTLATSDCLVLGDFSPKNILLVPSESGSDGEVPRLVLVDFETGHFGDPAFDLGFFLSHLLLKTVKHARRTTDFMAMVTAFWTAYRAVAPNGDEQRIVAHLAACMLARVDGKSTVDYLTAEAQAFVRQVTHDWLLRPPSSVSAAFTDLRRRLQAICSC